MNRSLCVILVFFLPTVVPAATVSYQYRNSFSMLFDQPYPGDVYAVAGFDQTLGTFKSLTARMTVEAELKWDWPCGDFFDFSNLWSCEAALGMGRVPGVGFTLGHTSYDLGFSLFAEDALDIDYSSAVFGHISQSAQGTIESYHGPGAGGAEIFSIKSSLPAASATVSITDPRFGLARNLVFDLSGYAWFWPPTGGALSVPYTLDMTYEYEAGLPPAYEEGPPPPYEEGPPPASVPEPATSALCFGGLLILAGDQVRRRMRR